MNSRALFFLPLSFWMLWPVASRAGQPEPPRTVTPPLETPSLPVERHLAIGGQGYFPVALRLQDGRIAVVLRGGGPHLSIQGRLDMIFSSDEGNTWTNPVVVVDSPLDDRNPSLGQAKDGTIVVGFWRTATYDDEGKYNPKLDKPRNTWVTRSKDGGQTWSEPAAIDVSDIGIGSPYGRMVTLPDGTMLMAIYGFEVLPPGKERVGDRNHSYVYRSPDDGQTWKRLSEIGDGKWQHNETTIFLTPDGKLHAAARSRGNDLWVAESTDNGGSWSQPQRITPVNVCPGDFCLLKDGRLLLTVGNRVGPFGVLGMVSDAEGHFDWEKRFSLTADAVSADCGYPSNILLKDGRVLTVYYETRSKEQPKWKVHCGAITYQPPAP